MRAAVISAAVISAAAVVFADAAKPPFGPPPVLDVPRLSGAEPTFDGDLSDPCWQSAAATTNDPAVRVLWSPDALFFAFDCDDAEVLCSGAIPHDGDLFREDAFEVFVDGAGDGRAFVELQVAPDGTTLDMIHLYTADPVAGEDGVVSGCVAATDRWTLREWDLSGLRAAARRREGGWSVELSVPADPAILRRTGARAFAPGAEIRAQFVRCDHPCGVLVQTTWSPCVAGCPHSSPSRFGFLRLLP